MTASKHLSITGGAHFLAQHLGRADTTIVGSDLYITEVPPVERGDMRGAVYPDLLVAFNVDPEAYYGRNGYVISEQGKPPDFVLEVASSSTGRRDVVEKRVSYEELGILEYWRFDETGRFHGSRLAGDRLVEGGYEPIEIIEMPDGSLRGRSVALGVELRWTEGALGWHDLDTGEHIATFATEREGRLAEREGRRRAEERTRELEEELRRLRGNG